METGLAGTGVVVTGASGGIGAACARAFAAEGARVVVHYHRGEERARALAAELGGAPSSQADLTDEADVERLFATAREAARRPRRLRRGRRRLPRGRRPGLGARARALRADARPEPDCHVPHRAWLPAAGAAEASRRARPRRLDGGSLRRGGARGLRRGEGGDPGRSPPLAEERGCTPRPARAGERGRTGLDGVADDARHARRRRRAPDHADDAAPQGRDARRTSRPRSSCSPPSGSPATSRVRSSRSPAGWKAASSTPDG